MISESRKQELFEEFLVPIEENIPENCIQIGGMYNPSLTSRRHAKIVAAFYVGRIRKEEYDMLVKEEYRRGLENRKWKAARNAKIYKNLNL